MDPYWDRNGHAAHTVKFESEAAVAGFPYCGEAGLNFSTSTATYSEDDGEYVPGRRGKTSRQDPLSHRIIEKRRRDRMNSCLADLSRLIPPQYLRKGRGRVEKTEIIEMAIRHLKHLQNQECLNRGNICAEQFHVGYQACLSETTRFLTGNGYFKEKGCKIIAHLEEHCNEVMKGEYSKSLNNSDTMLAPSRSPTNYHHTTHLTQFRDILPSDLEHNNSSNDQYDIKDLSFKSQPQQAPVITSTAPNSQLDTSNHDFDTIRATSSLSQPDNNSINHHDSVLRTFRMRKFSENNMHDEHNNNNYKFKNYIQQRFSQDNHIDESSSMCGTTGILANGCNIGNGKDLSNASSNSNCSNKTNNNNNNNINQFDLNEKNSNDSDIHIVIANGVGSGKKRKTTTQPLDSLENSSCDEKPTTNGITEFKNEINSTNLSSSMNHHNHHLQQMDVKPSIGSSVRDGHHSGANPVPIFALHNQGLFYIPLTVDYETLLPYLDGIDLFDKNYNHLTTSLHPININVNFIASPLKQGRAKVEGIVNGW